MRYVIISPFHKLAEERMPVFKLPLSLSGDVVQSISPWTAFMSPMGSQFGLINVTLGQSSAPEVEGDVLSDVGTYGKQLGQIGDALVVLLARMPTEPPLNKQEKKAIADLKSMLNQIADVKHRHNRPALRPDRL
jgi:hypothetical protein